MKLDRKFSCLLNAALLLVVVLAGYGLTMHLDSGRPAAQQTPSEPLSEFSFADIEGKSHKSADFRGKIVVINFWASWCAPCVKEFPNLLSIAAKNPDDVVLIALSSDKSEDDIRKFLQNQKVPGENVFISHDKEDITLKIFGISRLPETIIADHDLNRREKLVGAEWDQEMLQKIIDSLRK